MSTAEELREVLAELGQRGILPRMTSLRVGAVVVEMLPEPPKDDPERKVTAAEQRSAFDDAMYGASQGYIPGADA